MFSQQTEHFGLPQYQMGDHPEYLVDFDDAMKTIDKELFDAKTNANNALESIGNLTETVTKNVEDIAEIKAIQLQHRESINTLEMDVDNLKTLTSNQGTDLDMLKDSIGHYTDDAGVESVHGALDYMLSVLNGYESGQTVKDDVNKLTTSINVIKDWLTKNNRAEYTYNVTAVHTQNVEITHSDASYIHVIVKNGVMWLGLRIEGILSFINNNSGSNNISDNISFTIPPNSPIYSDLPMNEGAMSTQFGNCIYTDLDGNFFSLPYRILYGRDSVNINITLFPAPTISYSLQNSMIWFNPLEIFDGIKFM